MGEATSAYRTKLTAKYETSKCTSKLKRELLWEVKETRRVDYDTLDIISLYTSKKSVSSSTKRRSKCLRSRI